jgi:hypothetical protein
MVTYTPILKLAQPVFDQEPWDQEINGDMAIIDSALGSFFAIPGYIGIWQNNHLYAQGQTATDATDSSLWYCNVSHTSPAAPMTFAQDRAARPLNWTNQIPNGSDLADQANAAAIAAANSAAQAANSAAAAAAASANSVLKSGSTMTGPLVLSGDPSDVKGAATKQYVDARVGGTGFLPTTGGIITGNLQVNGVFAAATDRVYLGNNVRAYSPGIPPTFYGFNSTWNAAAGTFVANDGAMYFSTMDGNGNPTFHRMSLNVSGVLSGTTQINTNVLVASNQVQWGGLGSLWVDSTSTNVQFTTDGWKLQFNRTNGALSYLNNAGTNLFYIGGGGYVQAAGSILSLGGRLGVQNASTPVVYAYNTSMSTAVGMWCDSVGQLRLGPTDGAGGPTAYWATLHSQGIGLTNDGSIALYKTGNATNFQFNTNQSLLQYDATTNNFGYFRSDGQCPFQLRATDSALVNYVGPMVANAFVPSSDARLKTNVVDMTHGLDTLMQLRVVEFDWISNNRHDCGFIAQEVQPVYSDAVLATGIPIPDGSDGKMDDPSPSLGIDNSTMVALMAKSIQELTARVIALEAAQR